MKRLLFAFFIIFLASQVTQAYIASAQAQFSSVIQSTSLQPANLPSWVTNPPIDCFVGISRPCRSLEEARQQALNSAVSQILQAMGAEYSLSHKSILSGDLNYSEHILKERLSFTAKWFLKSVQQNIQECRFEKHEKRNICFVLVKLSASKLKYLQKLTIGPKITAKVIERNSNDLIVEASEINDVAVTLTAYKITTTIKNHHARLITLFAWKVPEGHTEKYQGTLEHSLHLKQSSAKATIHPQKTNPALKSIILGTETITKIVLTGYDEIGRFITVPVMNR